MREMEELEKQIERERQEIENAPKIPIQELMPKGTGIAGRCGVCGQFNRNLVPCHDIGPNGKILVERYKGLECGCGRRNY